MVPPGGADDVKCDSNGDSLRGRRVRRKTVGAVDLMNWRGLAKEDNNGVAQPGVD